MYELLPRDAPGDTCQTTSTYDGHQGLRILAVFIILISSGLGVYFPILSSRYSFIRLPDWCFFIAKFFGSGVIVATAFIHLLQPASEALGNDCLGGTFAEYPWAFGICLMSLFLLFFTEIVTHYYVTKAMGGDPHDHDGSSPEHSDSSDSFESISNVQVLYNREVSSVAPGAGYPRDGLDTSLPDKKETTFDEHGYEVDSHGNLGEVEEYKYGDDLEAQAGAFVQPPRMSRMQSIPGNNHYGHDEDHTDPSELADAGVPTPPTQKEKEQYLNQIFSVTILEFGIIFHSVFVGLSLSVSGEEFETLFIVLTFHQMFEGLGLGTRIAETPWPDSKKYTPWIMGAAFTCTSPIAAAIGIGVRNSFLPGSRTALITNGVFDSISSGILVYTGLVELMAHEFLYSNQFKGPDGFRRMLAAYFIMCCGAALMALLGKWA